jgi:hypothetical protein
VNSCSFCFQLKLQSAAAPERLAPPQCYVVQCADSSGCSFFCFWTMPLTLTAAAASDMNGVLCLLRQPRCCGKVPWGVAAGGPGVCLPLQLLEGPIPP